MRTSKQVRSKGAGAFTESGALIRVSTLPSSLLACVSSTSAMYSSDLSGVPTAITQSCRSPSQPGHVSELAR